MKRPTIKDISAAVGVSPSTVSRALKDHPDISTAIKDEVRRIADLLKYHPNKMAANLRNSKSNLIGLIIPEISMFFFPSVIKGIEQVVRNEGYQLLVLQSNDSLATEMLNIRVCSDQLVDGMIVSLSAETKSIDHLKDAGDVGIPIVLFDKCADNKIFDQVIINDIDAAVQCANFLIQSGAKRIAGVFGNEELSITKLRLSGFYKALLNAGFSENQIFIDYASGMNEAKEKTQKIIKDHHPDAFFFMSDEVLAGMLPAIKESGMKVKGDCSIIGISDGTLPLILDSQITYYHHNGFAVGAGAANRLIELIKNPTAEHQPKTIVIEGSVRLINSSM